EHGLGQADRQLGMDVAALAPEHRVGRHVHLDQRIARRTVTQPGRALAAQPQDLAVLQTGRDRDVEAFALRQGDARLGAVGRAQKYDREAVAAIHPAGTKPRAAGRATVPALREEAGEQVLEVLGVRGVLRTIARAFRTLGKTAVVLAVGSLGAGLVDLAAVVA